MRAASCEAWKPIEAKTSSGLHVNDVVGMAATSRRTLERRFKQTLNRSVYDEIRRQRLERTCRLLTDTRLSILDVALESGFQTASDLPDAFRRQIGMRPGDYRERFSTAIRVNAGLGLLFTETTRGSAGR